MNQFNTIGCSPYAGCSAGSPIASPYGVPMAMAPMSIAPLARIGADPAPAPPSTMQKIEDYLGEPLYEGSTIKKGYAFAGVAALGLGVWGYYHGWFGGKRRR